MKVDRVIVLEIVVIKYISICLPRVLKLRWQLLWWNSNLSDLMLMLTIIVLTAWTDQYCDLNILPKPHMTRSQYLLFTDLEFNMKYIVLLRIRLLTSTIVFFLLVHGDTLFCKFSEECWQVSVILMFYFLNSQSHNSDTMAALDVGTGPMARHMFWGCRATTFVSLATVDLSITRHFTDKWDNTNKLVYLMFQSVFVLSHFIYNLLNNLCIPNKFHNYTTSNILLTSTFRPPSAALFRNWMFNGHCSLDGVASRLSHTWLSL